MEVDINHGRLVEIAEEVKTIAQDAAVAARTTNIILLANAMGGLDVLDAIQLNKVLRHLEVVENAAGRDAA